MMCLVFVEINYSGSAEYKYFDLSAGRSNERNVLTFLTSDIIDANINQNSRQHFPHLISNFDRIR